MLAVLLAVQRTTYLLLLLHITAVNYCMTCINFLYQQIIRSKHLHRQRLLAVSFLLVPRQRMVASSRDSICLREK